MMTSTPTRAEKAGQKLSSKDLFRIQLIESPRISPDGKEIVFVRKAFDPENNDYRSQLCLIPSSGLTTEPGAFTQGPLDSEPCFSRDGSRIAFVRKVKDFQQIFVIPRGGGEATRITHFKNNVSGICWSPDGKKLAFTSSITCEGLIPENQKPEEDLYKKYNADVKVVDRIWYKLDGVGFLHDKRSHLFVVDLQSLEVAQLTFGEHEAGEPAFSPDGETIVFSSNRNPDSDYEPVSHIYAVSVNGGEPKNLTPGDCYFTNPVFSPDGKTVAFVGNDDPYNWYANIHLWIVPSTGGKPGCLTPKSSFCVGDQSINDLRLLNHGETPQWSRDSQILYCSVSESGKTYLLGVNLKNKSIMRHGEGSHVICAWDVAAPCDQAVVCKSDPLIPNDLWRLSLTDGTMERLTEVNAGFSKTFSIQMPESFTAKSNDGTLVQAWVLKPPGFQEGKKVPAILEIHGGPMAMYGWNFFYEFQLLANHGVVVVYSNPRGSMGYGQPFCEAIKGDWGNLDYQDLMAVLDHALQKGFIDEASLGVAGGSYGGFMTNWVVGHTDRFKAAVTMRSVVNEHSFYGTSDYGFWGEMNLGSLPWKNPEAYLKMSPYSYVENIKTPLLILHSEEDYRCPIEQAEQLFAALKKLKKEVLFIRFPGESHDLSRAGKPWHRVFRLDYILNWFESKLCS